MKDFLAQFKAFVAAQPAAEVISHVNGPCAVDKFLLEHEIPRKDVRNGISLRNGVWPDEICAAMRNITTPSGSTLYVVLDFIPSAIELARTYGDLNTLLEKSSEQ